MAERRPRRLTVDAQAPDPLVIEEAAACLRAGGLVAFPTETVYGLGARADDIRAVERLCRVKGRPKQKPFTIHLASAALVERMAIKWPAIAQALSQQFWPGPLTLVVARAEGGTVGLRVPRHPVAEALLVATNVPVIAPSANRAGQAPPTTAEAVAQALGADVDYVLDGGPTQLGESSTVVDCTVTPPKILRAGAQCQAIETAIRTRR